MKNSPTENAGGSDHRYLVARMHAAEALWRADESGRDVARGTSGRNCNAPERADLWPCALDLLRQWYTIVPGERTRRVLRAVVHAARALARLSPLRALKWTAGKLLRRSARRPSERELLRALREHTPPEEERLEGDYRARDLDQVAESFVLYRIVGNDLYPRHQRGQSRENVRFILENEPRFADCERRWILNRIVDPDERRAVEALLEDHGEHYIEIDFDAGAFCNTDFDVECYPYPGFVSSAEFEGLGPEQAQRAYTAAYRRKNNYVMNNNGARNHALADGQARAKWVLPFDGNCFLTPEAWEEIKATATRYPHLRYFVVPMQRITDNTTLIEEDPTDPPTAEPQIVFRFDAEERFNEDHPYGRRPKVELLRRLEVPGPWQYWRDDPWDQPTRPPAPEAGQFRAAGRVMRLASGVSHLEVSGTEGLRGRGFARQEAICETINQLTETHCGRPEELGLTSFRYESLEALRVARDADVEGPRRAMFDDLLQRAEAALARSPGAVVDKTKLPPSKDPHDYYHPAPYWWPNPKSRDGMPYAKRDGERVPGTGLYDEESNRYDRTRLQHLFDDGSTLALAWFSTGERRYAEHGAAWLRRWFLAEETRMNPHLRYAQVRWGHEGNRGQSSGIIEMKDLYYYLDAVRLFEAAGTLSAAELERFRAWLGEYLEWLTDSAQGRGERTASNNHGTYYDLQVASIAAYLGERTTLYRTLIRARDRMGAQYAPEGVPIPEMRRTQTAHYCCYNLQGWLNLAELARRYGDDLLHHEPREGGGLQAAVEWLGAHYGRPWPYKQIEPFNADRFVPLFALARTLGLEVPNAVADDIPAVAERTSCFDPHDGIRPFWALDVGALEAAT